jgi:hypothetical protein
MTSRLRRPLQGRHRRKRLPRRRAGNPLRTRHGFFGVRKIRSIIGFGWLGGSAIPQLVRRGPL